ncbi:MAG: hypothetical protein DGJ47_001165, partial [Rickettsiaceae bacterium]
EVSSYTKNLNFVLKQLPEFHYDGSNLFLDKEDESENHTVLLGDNKIIQWDLNNQLAPNQMVKIPVILRKSNINLHINDKEGSLIKSFSFNYSKLFGKEKQIISNTFLVDHLLNISNAWFRLIVYSVFPIISFLIFISTFFDKIILILMIYFISFLSKKPRPFKDVTRVVLFSSGFSILAMNFMPFMPNIVSGFDVLISIWINLLMVIGIVKNNIKFQMFR